ncbi:5-formyltetrahydrofolate cyclo-ligase [Candidatus Peribacteria bacterium]|nr:5-formyltetrahydrofolate cyclo-ligase [Candidatus Peribacteria bacterium]
MHIQDEKAALRMAIEERLKRMTDAERSAESRSLCRRLTEGIPEGTSICAFYPMRSEPDITPFLEEVLRRGDPLYLPCFDGTLIFRKAKDLEALVRGKLGTREPAPDAPVLDFSSEQTNEQRNPFTVLLPGRAFDAHGNRLGRGNGGYDQWLHQEQRHRAAMRLIGVALECQIVDKVPVESHDQRMDALATARGVQNMKK